MKSIETQFAEALEALNKVGKRAKFNEKNKITSPIEVQLNLAEAMLKESRVIRKHNGVADNFIEGNPFGEQLITESYVTETDNSPVVAMQEASVERLKKTGLSEATARGIFGLPAKKAPEGLTRRQLADYNFAVRCGLKESDALQLAKMPL